MMSLIAAVSVGSVVQNITFYLFLFLLGYLNYCLIATGSEERRGKIVDAILSGLIRFRRIMGEAREVRESQADLVNDVNELVLKEKLLEERIAGLENVLERMTDPLYIVDRDWNFTYINRKYEQVQGRDRAELLGRNVWELFPYGKERRYFKEYDRAMREQISVHFEEFNTFNEMWVSACAYPVKSGLAVCFRDITEEKLRRN